MATTTASSSDKEVYHNVQEKDVQIVNRSGSEGDASVEAGEVNNPLHRKLESRHMQMIAIGMFVLSCLSCLLFFSPLCSSAGRGWLGARMCNEREGGRERISCCWLYLLTPHFLFFPGGAIGAGLFVGSGSALQKGGPAALVMGFMVSTL